MEEVGKEMAWDRWPETELEGKVGGLKELLAADEKLLRSSGIFKYGSLYFTEDA